ncbi:ATP-dependent RNA helicase DDX51/DBP6, partial [Clonorchis sinensis]
HLPNYRFSLCRPPFRLPNDGDASSTALQSTTLPYPMLKCTDGDEVNSWDSMPPFEVAVATPPTSDLLVESHENSGKRKFVPNLKKALNKQVLTDSRSLLSKACQKNSEMMFGSEDSCKGFQRELPIAMRCCVRLTAVLVATGVTCPIVLPEWTVLAGESVYRHDQDSYWIQGTWLNPEYVGLFRRANLGALSVRLWTGGLRNQHAETKNQVIKQPTVRRVLAVVVALAECDTNGVISNMSTGIYANLLVDGQHCRFSLHSDASVNIILDHIPRWGRVGSIPAHVQPCHLQLTMLSCHIGGHVVSSAGSPCLLHTVGRLRSSGDAEAAAARYAGVGIALSDPAEASLLDWILVDSRLTMCLLETQRQISPGRSHNSTRRIIRHQTGVFRFFTTDALEALLVLDGVKKLLTRLLVNGYLIVQQILLSRKTSTAVALPRAKYTETPYSETIVALRASFRITETASDLMSNEQSVDTDDPIVMNSDSVIGGFTVIGDKLRYDQTKPTEMLPFWITQATYFPSDLSFRQKVEDLKELNPFMQSRLVDIGCSELFPVQACVIPSILRSYRLNKRRPLCRPSDICIAAPTGSGKTLAYSIPLIQLLHGRVQVFLRALVILPVRDLAAQVFQVLLDLAEGTDLRVSCLLICTNCSITPLQIVLINGSKSFMKEQLDLVDTTSSVAHTKADIVVATPGRLVDHIYNTVGFSLERLRILVIDEADRVISEEKQDWYRILEDALYHPNAFAFDIDGEIGYRRPTGLQRTRPVMTIMHQYDTSHDITLQKILASATLTHDPEPLKRFNLYFPHLFASSTSAQPRNSNGPIVCDIGHAVEPDLEPPMKKKKKQKKKIALSEGMAHNASHTDCSETVQDAGGVGVFSTPPGLKEYVVAVQPEHRALFLIHLIRHENVKRVLCFTNSRTTAARLHMLLSNFKGIRSYRISGHMPPDKRQRVLSAFTRNELDVLVCTDSMARGMDVKEVNCVVSYEMPPNVKIYVHRVGRTARAGQPGLAYTLLNKNQFFHFKKDLRAVGKQKLKEVTFHASHFAHLQEEYKQALGRLEEEVKTSSKPATGRSTDILQTVKSARNKRQKKRKISKDSS